MLVSIEAGQNKVEQQEHSSTSGEHAIDGVESERTPESAYRYETKNRKRKKRNPPLSINLKKVIKI